MRLEVGFDRMLGGFFMNVMDASGSRDGFIYDSLADEELFPVGGFPRSLDRYTQVLGDMGIALPGVMLDELMKDQRSFVGNRIVIYDESGQIQSGG